MKLADLFRRKRAEAPAKASIEAPAAASEPSDEWQRERYRREFLGNISHELKTPLFTTQGYITTLLDGALDDSAVSRNYLERAERNIDRMIAIVTDLEEIAKLEAGILELRPRRFDLAAATRDIALDAAMEADKRSIALLIDGLGIEQPHTPVWVVADRKAIEQVMWNLIMNSIKYGRQGGRTEIRFTSHADHVAVAVNDNGIGIAPEELPRVFERFYRSDRSRARETGVWGGSGLGLSIVKHLLEAHAQPVGVTSDPRCGTTFSFRLPRR